MANDLQKTKNVPSCQRIRKGSNWNKVSLHLNLPSFQFRGKVQTNQPHIHQQHRKTQTRLLSQNHLHFVSAPRNSLIKLDILQYKVFRHNSITHTHTLHNSTNDSVPETSHRFLRNSSQLLKSPNTDANSEDLFYYVPPCSTFSTAEEQNSESHSDIAKESKIFAVLQQYFTKTLGLIAFCNKKQESNQ